MRISYNQLCLLYDFLRVNDQAKKTQLVKRVLPLYLRAFEANKLDKTPDILTSVTNASFNAGQFFIDDRRVVFSIIAGADNEELKVQLNAAWKSFLTVHVLGADIKLLRSLVETDTGLLRQYAGKVDGLASALDILAAYFKSDEFSWVDTGAEYGSLPEALNGSSYPCEVVCDKIHSFSGNKSTGVEIIDAFSFVDSFVSQKALYHKQSFDVLLRLAPHIYGGAALLHARKAELTVEILPVDSAAASLDAALAASSVSESASYKREEEKPRGRARSRATVGSEKSAAAAGLMPDKTVIHGGVRSTVSEFDKDCARDVTI